MFWVFKMPPQICCSNTSCASESEGYRRHTGQNQFQFDICWDTVESPGHTLLLSDLHKSIQ